MSQQEYRNSSNRDRSSAVNRKDNIATAGEVFTPSFAVDKILTAYGELILDKDKRVLEPAAGDGNFFCPLVETRIESVETLQEALAAVKNLWAVEIQEDNVLALRERTKEVFLSRWPEASEGHELATWLESNIQQGNYLTGRACGLACGKDCSSHNILALPARFDLILGNPPYNPGRIYKDFILKALAESVNVSFIVPTAWKLSDTFTSFRREILPRLSSVEDLPWDTFAIKMRTTIVIFMEEQSDSYLLNGVQTSAAAGSSQRVANSVLSKAYEQWPTTLRDYMKDVAGFLPVHLGWKCNTEKGKGKINALQSIAYSKDSPLLPNNTYSFFFPSSQERSAFVSYSSTKLAAYLQSLTDSDTISRILPLPPLNIPSFDYTNDAALYELLGLTKDEIKEIERFTLFVSAKAKEFYYSEGITLRSDGIIGKERSSCSECGSSSFHKKGCSFGTDRERQLRDSKD